MDLRRTLSFADVDWRIEDYLESSARRPPGPVERWSFGIGLLAAGVGSLLAMLVGGPPGLRIVQAALALECAGLWLSLCLMIKREWRMLRQAKRDFAEELDADYIKYRECVVWLCDYPDAEVARRLRYVRDRKSAMGYRLGLVTGGVERMGILPVLVALYLQFRDWEFGNWNALGQVNVVGGLLLWALLLVYVASWYVIGLKGRLDAYDFLLSERLQSRST